MSQAIDFKGSNLNLMAAPGDQETVNNMRAFTHGRDIVECWKLSPEELADVALTGCVWLTMSTQRPPPIYVGSEDTVRSMVADNGAWRKT